MENFMTEEWIQQMQNHVDTLEKLTQKSKPSLVSEWLHVDWKQVLKKSISIKLLKGFPAHADSNALFVAPATIGVIYGTGVVINSAQTHCEC